MATKAFLGGKQCLSLLPTVFGESFRGYLIAIVKQ